MRDIIMNKMNMEIYRLGPIILSRWESFKNKLTLKTTMTKNIAKIMNNIDKKTKF